MNDYILMFYFFLQVPRRVTGGVPGHNSAVGIDRAEQTTVKPAATGSGSITSHTGNQRVTARQIDHHKKFSYLDQIEGLAFYTMAGVENITLINEILDFSMDVYSLSPIDDPNLIASCICGNVAAFTVQSNGYHFILNREDSEVLVHTWPLDITDPSFKQDTREVTGSHITCTSDYYFYPYRQDGQVHIACLSTARMPPKFEWSVKTGISKLRAMSAMERGHSVSVLVSKAIAFGQKVNPQEMALKAIRQGGPAWEISYRSLDSDSKQFDLRSIDNDGTNYFVLNSKTRSVHVISCNGQVLNKILQNLSKPILLSVNKEAKKLALVENHNIVNVFELLYS